MYSRDVVVLIALLAAVMPFGGLFVSSLPAGADVWVDGSYIGRSPVLIDGLRAGKHSLTITKAGWKVYEIDELVSAGVTTPSSVQLTPLNPTHEPGSIALHGLAPNATVWLDGGAPRPLSSRYDVSSGVHHLVVRQTQTKFQRDVFVYPDQTTHVLFHTPEVEAHSAVVAPLADYVPVSAAKIKGDRLVLQWAGHYVVGHLGDSKFVVDGRDVVYDAPAGLVSGRLYLPLQLLLTVTDNKPK